MYYKVKHVSAFSWHFMLLVVVQENRLSASKILKNYGNCIFSWYVQFNCCTSCEIEVQ